VKNLENVQGDERDQIFISVGYARNAQGHMAMNFGPLGAEGGERRLNVLISRAKRRCMVFASITDEDIDLERARELLSQAAAAGSPWGMNNLAGLYEMGWGVARDLKKARELYEKAAARGLEVARRNLARLKRRMAAGDAKPAGRAATAGEKAAASAGGTQPSRSGTSR